MEQHEENKKGSMVQDTEEPFMKTFSSQEEAERYRMVRALNRTGMEKFRLFCRMMRINKMLSSARIIK